MQITINLPEDVIKVFAKNGENVERKILEAATLEGYRAGKLSQAQLRRTLGFATDMQVDAFLKENGIFLEYDLEDVKRETEFSLKLAGK